MSKFYEALEIAGYKAQNRDNNRLSVVSDEPLCEFISPKLSRELVVVREPDSEITEYFRFLRSFVTRPASGQPPRTIMITSALMGEGKTFVASNLAAAIGQSLEEYALLVDADLRKPKLHETFGLGSNNKGLTTFLSENAPLSELLTKTPVEKLTVLRAGNSAKIPAELLSSEKMKKLIKEIKSRYDDRFVIIDTSPLLLTPETAVIAKEVDAVLLVVRYGKTPRHAVRSALKKIPKEKILGIIFNASEKKIHEGYYSGYKYGYGKEKKS